MPEREKKRGFDVRFADETKKEFRKLGPSARHDILSAIQKKLTDRPTEYGEPLVRELIGYRKLPVGQWRVVYYVEEEKVLVLVLAVGKRAEGDHENIYDQITKGALDTRLENVKRRTEEERRQADPKKKRP